MGPPPFDWDRYWSQGPPRSLVAGGKHMARRLLRFARTRGLDLHDLADVGCGPAVALFQLARRMPRCDCYGFDASRTVLRSDTRRAKQEGFRNLHFRYGRLPDLGVERQFDLVTCMATLHYVPDAKRALHSLYALVRPGGYLILNYPNERQRMWYRAESLRDPSVKARFALVLAGKNLLSRAVVERTLHRRPESFWRTVGEPVLWNNPCVAIPK